MKSLLRLLLVALPLASATAAVAQEPAGAQLHPQLVVPFLKQHCFRCHGPDKQDGDLRLDGLEPDFTTRESARRWLEVMDRLNSGEMPPDGEPRPAIGPQQQVTRWIARSFASAAGRHQHRRGVLLRRMNRTEYANTLRDLLDIRFLPGQGPLDLLPPDGKAEGFDKVSTALMLDPSLLEKYFEVAQLVAQQAIVEGEPAFPTRTVRYEFEDTRTWSPIKYLCTRPSFLCRENDVAIYEGNARTFGKLMYGGGQRMIPTKGFYKFRVRASAVQGISPDPVRMIVRRDGGEAPPLWEGEVTAPPDAPQVYEFTLPQEPAGGNELGIYMEPNSKFHDYNRPHGHFREAIRQAGESGDFARSLELQARQRAEGILGNRPREELLDKSQLPHLILDWIEVEGPLYDDWPPKSHQRIFFEGEGAQQDLDYARRILRRLMPRAYRRIVQPEEIEPVVGLVEAELAAGASFEEAIRVALSAVLTSPNFLYLDEPKLNTDSRPLSGFELASRLSYFLWSSMPDGELFRLASQGQLSEPAVLQAQVDRMLADPKAESLTSSFAAQWLRTGEFRTFTPDKRNYPDYNDKLGEAMVQETLSFFREILHSDESVLNFLDSDFSMLNERLAEFYGISGVEGEEFRRVQLPSDAHRGGLLSQAGVLMYGSDGSRTKPVRRGVYVLEVLFNDPPDPPPPNVGEIEPNIEGENLTVRDRLLAHQQIESCAACHRGIDPYGLALENYNVIGAWRTEQDGEDFRGRNRPEIDASGRLPSGKEFASPAEFKALLASQQDRFCRALAEKMLTYALGRPIEPSDRATTLDLCQHMAENGYTMRSLIQAIVASETFRTK